MASSSKSEPSEAEKAALEKKFKRETRCTIYFVLGIVVVMSLSMGIIWAVVRPKHPVVAIEMGYITTGTLTPTILRSNLEFVIRFYNPNKKATIYYDSMEFYNHIATGITNVGHRNESFSQPALNVTRVNCSFEISFRTMFSHMERYINNGQLSVKISMKANIRFGVGKWKSKPQTVGIYCRNRKVRLERSYETTSCYFDL